VTEDAEKLDRIVGQVADLRVLLERVLTTVDGLADRLDRGETRFADHEARLRVIEAHGTAQLADLAKKVQWLREWRAQLVGIALGVGAVSGGAAAGIVKAVGG
jgi:hypothetical protein